jgi:single-strand DNA-binding protein
VVVEEVEFAESKANNPDAGNRTGVQNNFRPEPSTAAGDGFMNIPDGIDEELPFN